MRHYLDLFAKYENPKEIYKKMSEEVREKLKSFADNQRYRFKTYLEMNPSLQQSPFIDNLNALSGDIIRFRLGSHVLPIETGRWTRTPRDERLCRRCNVLGDERHPLYSCCAIVRDSLELPVSLSEIWDSEDVFALFDRLKEAELLN